MRRGVATWILLAGVAVSWLAPRASIAGDTAAAERPGRELFERAETKFNVGRFDEALVDYQAAYDVEPLPAFLFNIGQCYRNLGNYERAQFFFRRYTALEPRSPNRAAAERLIAEMDRLAAEREAAKADAQPTMTAAPSLAAPAPAEPPAVAPLQASVAKTSDDRARTPVYRRTWFWVAASAVVVAGGVATAFAVTRDDPRSSLRPIDTR
jgi:tetratricopeptide (TPR) repeat protein